MPDLKCLLIAVKYCTDTVSITDALSLHYKRNIYTSTATASFILLCDGGNVKFGNTNLERAKQKM